LGETVRDAQTKAYDTVRKLDWSNKYYRDDIAYRAIAREEKK